MATINPGDFVMLKSGGPKMTVSHLGGMHSDTVVATWFNELKQEFCKEVLKIEQVKLVPATD